MSDRKVLVSWEIVTVWEFTVDQFIETYREEWEHDGKPDPEKWVRQSIEEFGTDQLDRVSPGMPDDREVIVTIRDA